MTCLLETRTLLGLNMVSLGLCIAAAALFFLTATGSSESQIRVLFLFLALSLTAGTVVLRARNVLNFWSATVLVLLASSLLRMYYIACTPYDISTHDLGNFLDYDDTSFASGHLAYIKYLYAHHSLPEFDPRPINAFYNPPFFHFVAATWLSLADLFSSSGRIKLESLQYLSFACATVAINTSCAILREFDIKPKSLFFGTIAFAFMPSFIIIGAALNNDMMAIMFYFLTVLYTIRWGKTQDYKNALLTAFFLGLGMVTKYSIVLITPAIAIIFLWSAVKGHRSTKDYALQCALFFAVAAPLFLAYSAHNYFSYGILPTYVPPQGSTQYVGNYAVSERIIPFHYEALEYVFFRMDPATEHNIWNQLFKTSLFDERNYAWAGNWVNKMSYLLLIMNITIAMLTKAMMLDVCFLKKFSISGPQRAFILVADSILLGSYVKFCFDYPYICTMNFRYIVPTAIFACIGMAFYGNPSHENDRSVIRQGLILGLDTMVGLSAAVGTFLYIKISGFHLFAG